MKRNTDLISKYKLDRYSPIQEDAMLLNLDLASYRHKKASIVESTILALFSNQTELIIFCFLPSGGHRLSEITINGKTYGCQFFDQDGFVHKYYIPLRFKAGNLKITGYQFVDDSLKKTTRSVKEEHVFGILDDQYFYDSKRYFTTEVVGELFHELVDMTTIKDKFNDSLGRLFLYRDIASFKSNSIKLYYVAFNLFDQEKQTYFVPDDMIEMKVRFDEHRYVYQSKSKMSSSAIRPYEDGETIVTNKKETIQKEPRKIESGEKSQWNLIQNFFSYKLYAYDSIYKMTSTVKTQHKEAQNFTYALVIGPKMGYRHSERVFERGFKKSYDIDITTLKNIAIYHITYQQKGHRYAVPVASMVYESDRKGHLPRFKNRLVTFIKQAAQLLAAPFRFVFGAGGVIFKIIRWLMTHWKLVLILLLLGGLVYLGFVLNGIFQWI
jgi:hypothetical protein